MPKRHLIFLHGALGSKGQWERFLDPFMENFQIHAIDFPGHGDSSLKLENYTCHTLTDFVKDYITRNNIQNFSVIGYSLGGYIGLNLLLEKMKGFHSLITLSTKLSWDKAIAAEACAYLTTENLSTIEDKLRNEHGDHFEYLLLNTREILTSIGYHPIDKTAFRDNTTPVRMLLGSKDKMVSQDEIEHFTENLPLFSLEVLENQPHTIEKMDKGLISDVCLRFLKL